MNILITGANGQLGQSIRADLPLSVTNKYIFAGSNDLDITQKEQVSAFLKNEDIDVIVNCAAYTAVDKAEDEPLKADLINHVAVGHMAEEIRKRNGFLIHISTDYIYGGADTSNEPLTEDSTPDPVSVYGKSKLDGENAILKSGARSIILRTAWLYSEYGHNFMKTMLSLFESHNEIKVVNDQKGTPTYAGNLAKAIISIVEQNKLAGYEGIYNFTDEGVATWFSFAKSISEFSNNTRCKIMPCTTAEYPAKAQRPSYSVLDKSKFKTVFGTHIPHWEESLKSLFNK